MRIGRPQALGRAKYSLKSFYKANRHLQPAIGILNMMLNLLNEYGDELNLDEDVPSLDGE